MKDNSVRMNAVSESTLRAGAAVVDITPPLDVGLLLSSVRGEWGPFSSVRLPLKGRVLALESGKETVVLIALDLLGLSSKAVGGWTDFKRSIAGRVSRRLLADRIVFSCTHTHNSPETCAVTNLYKTPQCKRWIDELRVKLADAINAALAALKPCSMEFSVSKLMGYSLQRRIITKEGVIMSDSVQPIAPELFKRGPIDHRVGSLLFRETGGAAISTIVHAICHPVHEMCLPQISADFPGEVCAALENDGAGGVPLFFNGAAGDINPPTVSDGAATAHRHGNAIADQIKRHQAHVQPIQAAPFRFCRRTIRLPQRSLSGTEARTPATARLNALRLGSLALLFLPGEIFTDTALAIEQSSPFSQTLVIGFSEATIGYLPTERAFCEGGYEIGPGKWSYLQPSAESILRAESISLLQELFETSEQNRNQNHSFALEQARL